MNITVQLLAQVVTEMSLLQQHNFPVAPARTSHEAVLMEYAHLLLVLVKQCFVVIMLTTTDVKVAVQQEHCLF